MLKIPRGTVLPYFRAVLHHCDPIAHSTHSIHAGWEGTISSQKPRPSQVFIKGKNIRKCRRKRAKNPLLQTSMAKKFLISSVPDYSLSVLRQQLSFSGGSTAFTAAWRDFG